MSVTETTGGLMVCVPNVGLEGTAVEVYRTFARLDIRGRRILEDKLLEHAFLPNGLACYGKLKKNQEYIFRTPYLELLDGTSLEMANAWSDLAFETSLRDLPVAFCRGMILDLLSDLVRLRLKEQPQPGAGTYTLGKDAPVVAYSPVNVRGAGIEVCRIYAGLMTPERWVLEDILLGHAFLPGGPNAYGGFGDWNLADRRQAYLQLKSLISLQMANAWHDWAYETSMNHSGPDSCREVVKSMLSDLVRLKHWELYLFQVETLARKKARSKKRKQQIAEVNTR